MTITQSFLYNAIFFTYALVLTKIHNVPSSNTAYYFMVFAAGNLAGPLLLGRLFDSVGRRKRCEPRPSRTSPTRPGRPRPGRYSPGIRRTGPIGTVTEPAEPARVRGMKKLIVLAVLVGLGIFAAQKLRSS